MIERFHAYAAAFEAAYDRDDWTLLEPYFTEDAISELNGARVAGRDAVLTSFRDAVTMFDRRFDSRRLHVTRGPEITEGRVYIRAVARYERAGLPPLELVGDEWFTFEGDRIRLHVDRVLNGTEVMAYLASHADALRPLTEPPAASTDGREQSDRTSARSRHP